MVTRDVWNERRIAGALLLFGFLLVFPTVIIGAPGMGRNSVWGQTFPFLFVTDWVKYWRSAFAVVTLFGLVILESVLFQAGDHIFAKLGMFSFTLATGMWLVMDVLDTNGERGGRELESYFILLAFAAVGAYGLGLARTRLLPTWIGIVTVLYTTVALIYVFPNNRGPLFYEPALILIGMALLLPRYQERTISTKEIDSSG